MVVAQEQETQSSQTDNDAFAILDKIDEITLDIDKKVADMQHQLVDKDGVITELQAMSKERQNQVINLGNELREKIQELDNLWSLTWKLLILAFVLIGCKIFGAVLYLKGIPIPRWLDVIL